MPRWRYRDEPTAHGASGQRQHGRQGDADYRVGGERLACQPTLHVTDRQMVSSGTT